VKRAYTSKLSNMLGTQEKAEAHTAPADGSNTDLVDGVAHAIPSAVFDDQ
jgi:hypothetical protein